MLDERELEEQKIETIAHYMFQRKKMYNKGRFVISVYQDSLSNRFLNSIKERVVYCI